MSNVLEGLNEEQIAAVTHASGPLMIIAGAGTGKTTVMTRRIAWLIEQGLAEPDQILALTFTDKAAAEMEERVDLLLPYGYVDLWISTFHAFCQRILQEHGLDVGVAPDADLLNETDAWLLMQKHWDRFHLTYYKPLGNPTKFLQALLQHISRLKDEGVMPSDYRRHVESLVDVETEEMRRLLELVHAYEVYESILHEAHAMDFGGLILYALALLRDRPLVLVQYQQQFHYIIVDEFQDTNWAQYEIVRLLAAASQQVAVVGDDDQAIYQFRGASVANILAFEKDFPNTARVVLTKNYRTVQPILDKAYDFIVQNNPHRLEVSLQATHGLSKQLISQVGDEGTVKHLHARIVEAEVQMVLREMLALKQSTDCDWSDMALLVRANSHAEPFLEGMDTIGIPYTFLAMRGLYRKPVVLDAIALLRAIDDPFDAPSLYRVFSHPVIGIPEQDLLVLTHTAKKKGMAIMDVLQLSDVTISSEGVARLSEWQEFFSLIRASAKRRNALEVLAEALKKSGLYGSILQLDEAQQLEQSSYLQQFYERVRRFIQTYAHGSLHLFLEAFALEQLAGEEGSLSLDLQSGPDEVRVMTVHGSKGLEFKSVFLLNMVDRRFPAQHRQDSLPIPSGLIKQAQTDGDPFLEEERRLLYVGMTRAKERLYLTSADGYGGARQKKLSRFMMEMGYEKPDLAQTFHGASLETSLSVDHVFLSGANLPVPSTFSFTQLVAYNHCPLQYKFAHVLNIPTFGGPALSFGKTMHNTLQTFFETFLAMDASESSCLPMTEDQLINVYREKWINDWYQDERQQEGYRQQGEESLRAYYQIIQEHPPRPLFLERGFTIKIDDIVIRGRVDRIDAIEGGVEIIDYKTGTPKTKKDLSATDKMQLMLYQLAAKELFGLEPKQLTFHYLQDHSHVSFLATEQQLDTLKQRIREEVTQIRARKFDPTPGFMCQYCDFKDICPFKTL
ncbi:hypothetical protein COV06_00800 [Candidatus Uhrbacteria bacterium CG10_big_fil_rev_8_21_14_0_10_50_16]|uniref:DNA 3'-5' helicase n=1 Tax=Candidatus Uhrbacteria bacterium CG10_big_fil_rev_8_21_14_0_10_50_16 TaxID=1975039 RepID=A0A2H0RQ95_9BACT|nr:MAG: hypothetical protein COV06_00800 [Candidatus Uhrbacteria bacterium CG10_big_fil_rev_8_21_14_0_10_50_16]